MSRSFLRIFTVEDRLLADSYVETILGGGGLSVRTYPRFLVGSGVKKSLKNALNICLHVLLLLLYKSDRNFHWGVGGGGLNPVAPPPLDAALIRQ